MSFLLPRCPKGWAYSEESMRYIPVEVQNITGPSATHFLSDGAVWQQKYHPLDAMRQAGYDGGTVKDVRGVNKRVYRNRLCTRCEERKAAPGRPTCSQCRTDRKQCRCGRRMSHDSTRCIQCTRLNRKAPPRLWV